ncbi:hypothetical protein AYI70_g6586, partial [Smittium culicis]
MFPAAPGCP